jgi:hypothetical protein
MSAIDGILSICLIGLFGGLFICGSTSQRPTACLRPPFCCWRVPHSFPYVMHW